MKKFAIVGVEGSGKTVGGEIRGKTSGDGVAVSLI